MIQATTGFRPAHWDMTRFPVDAPDSPVLQEGARVAVVGGGPAGAFFSYFLLRMAASLGRRIAVDVYEPKDFDVPGPLGCNMCGGIISESLVQCLAAEGINLPPTVVKRGIESYVLHVPEGSVRIATPVDERRIAAVHRGAGPRGSATGEWRSFDAYLLELAVKEGARWIKTRVEGLSCAPGRPPIVTPKEGDPQVYDLLVVAAGVNAGLQKLTEGVPGGYAVPQLTRAFICELELGREAVQQALGNAMHVFLLDIPKLDFAALIPKSDHVTVALLGIDIDSDLVEAFLESPEVTSCMPPGWRSDKPACKCSPRMNVGGSELPFGDRLVFVGDCGVSRLFKDGIGAAYRTAKAAAYTALFEGISEKCFRKTYLPVCKSLENDNAIGKRVFAAARLQQRSRVGRSAMLAVVAREQTGPQAGRRLSGILWDLFTGSAPYKDILKRAIGPFFVLRFAWEVLMAWWFGRKRVYGTESPDSGRRSGELGHDLADGEVLVTEGDVGACMYVIQTGSVQISHRHQGVDTPLALLGPGEIIGEMALFEDEVRSATARAVGPTRVLTVDKATFLRKVHGDPSLAFRMLRRLSRRVRDLNDQVVRIKGGQPAAAPALPIVRGDSGDQGTGSEGGAL